MELSQITFDFDDTSEKKPEVKKTDKNILLENPLLKAKPTRGRRSLQAASDEDLIEIPEDEILFQKAYYSIGDVSAMFHENASLIRYWEKEFDILKPKKNKKGDRLFRPEDVKNLKLIYHLLRERKYTLEGAKDFLKNNKTAAEKFEMILSCKS